MSATRSRKEEKTYKRYQSTADSKVCVFCALKPGDEQLLNTTKYFNIVKNKFGYSIWDGQQVTDHLMVVPIKHTDTLQDLTPAMATEYLQLISRYEQNGYNVYARAPSSKIKSVAHQHTHLIKTEGTPKKLIVLLRKPYYLRIAV